MLCSIELAQPLHNVSACEEGTATFTCVVIWPSETNPSSATWATNSGFTNAADQPGHTVTSDYDGRVAPTTVTTTLTVTNVNITDNNGSDYVCVQGSMRFGDTVYLTVIGKLYLSLKVCSSFKPET